MGTVGHHPVLIQQHDSVGQRNGRQAVGDDQRRAAFHLNLQAGMDGLLHLDVNGTGGIVEHHHRWVDQQSPGDSDALALATREGVAPLTDHGVVSVGEVADELVSPGRGGRRFDLLVGGRWSAVGDVVANGYREQERLVEDDPDVGPQAGLGELADIVSVEFD